MRFPFHFRLIPFIATLVIAMLGVALGNWQQGRAAQKLAVQEKLATQASQAPVPLGTAIAGAVPPLAETLEYRRVRLTGEFLADWPLFLANRPMAGRPGYYLVMPFKIAESNTHVLVMRGWFPRAAEFGKLPAIDTPTGPLSIEGIVVASAGNALELGEPMPLSPGAIIQNLDPARMASATGLSLLPFFIQQTGTDQPNAADGQLLRAWPSPATGIDKHRGYAFQWYALAAMAILFYVTTGFRSGSRKADARKPEAGTSDAGK